MEGKTTSRNVFFSTVQPDFKQLSLPKWDLHKPSSKQKLDRYVVVFKNDVEVESESVSEEEQDVHGM